MLLELGKLEEAERECRAAIAVLPHGPGGGYTTLGDIIIAKGMEQDTVDQEQEQGICKEADEAYRTALTLDNSNL